MLHEVLIVLAGHESPFVTRHPNSIAVKEGLLHKAEQALLVQVAVLGQIHSDVVKRIEWIQQLTHKKSDQDETPWISGPYPPSSHAVASSIDTGLVRPFMAKIIELEKRILARDSSFVGGDRVVSLSAIVAETVQRWERRFRYAQTLLGYLITGIKPKICHEVLERLESDRVTGYEDVKQLVMVCISAVQRTWLQQLGCWVLYGRLPRYTEGDFMIDKHSSDSSSSQKTVLYELVESRIPPMCTPSAAADIYAIGNSLAQLQTDGAAHESLLKSIELPIKESQLTAVMAQIKSLVFRGIVSTRLPIDQIRRLFATLVSIPLVGAPDFAVSVIEAMLVDRPALAKSPRAPHDRFRQALEAFLEDLPVDVKAGEKFSLLHNGLSLGYIPVKDAQQVSKPDRFDDLLVGLRCKLAIRLEWPLSLLVPETDSQRYTFAFSYLIALRSVNYRLASLWRRHLSLDMVSDSKIWSLAYRAKMVLDILWDHAQNTVIAPLYHEKVVPVLEPENGGIDPQLIIATHTEFLSDVCHMLLIDSESVRTALRSFFIGCTVLVERLTANRLSDYEPTELLSQISMLVDTIETEPESDPKINLLLLKLECLKS